MASDETEGRQTRKLIRIEPGIIFIVLISGVLIFLVSLTVRTQSRGSTTSSGSFASGIDEDTIVLSAVEPPSSSPHSKDPFDDADDSTISEDKAAVALLIDKIELLIDEMTSSGDSPSYQSIEMPSTKPSTLTSASPSAQLSQMPSTEPFAATSAFPSTIPSGLSTTVPSFEPTVINTTEEHNILTTEGVPISNSSNIASSQASNENTNSNATTINSTFIYSPTLSPMRIENYTDTTTLRPSSDITPFPTSKQPTQSPSQHPTNLTNTCFTTSVYDSIDADIAELKLTITDNTARSHFLGGIVRLAAHDFLDYDRRSSRRYGPDGCYDADHEANRGLPESVWCETCLLRVLYENKYNFLSRADFWIASSNAVIRQTSINNSLDLKEQFTWGRIDRDSCEGSGDRLPVPSGCNEVEDAFMNRMGLEWKDAVALMGAHSLGRGNALFSGHDGVWVKTADDAQVFDKQYYEELYLNAWRPRNAAGDKQDWTTGSDNGANPRMMLNTDMCLVYDIDSVRNNCCSRTNLMNSNGENACMSSELARSRCPFYSRFSPRREAVDAVNEYLGGEYPNDNNEPFYSGFKEAWGKATTLGWEDLKPLVLESCEDEG